MFSLDNKFKDDKILKGCTRKGSVPLGYHEDEDTLSDIFNTTTRCGCERNLCNAAPDIKISSVVAIILVACLENYI